MKVVIAGAGFGGLEIATSLSETLGDGVTVTLIDKNDSFVFGYAKLDVMFGRTAPDAIHLPYRAIAKPGVTFRRVLLRRRREAAARHPAGVPRRDRGRRRDDAALQVPAGAERDIDADARLPDRARHP